MSLQDATVLSLLHSAQGLDAIDIRIALERSARQVARAHAVRFGPWSFTPPFVRPTYDDVAASLTALCAAGKARIVEGRLDPHYVRV